MTEPKPDTLTDERDAHDRMVTAAAEARGAEALATEARLRAEADREAAERELQALREIVASAANRLPKGSDVKNALFAALPRAPKTAHLSTTPDTEEPDA